MKLEYVSGRNWDAIRCVSRHGEMVAGVSAGPRILSLPLGAGSNLRFHAP
jgi:hypothetical protein